ncbi:MAG: DUF1570 domain-containing protein [Planctomycetes bacterium]|nr:DUF1570 domain-containing protein [Planctomycetota bacterium]
MAPNPLLDASFQSTTTAHFVLLHEPGAGYVAGACRTLEYAYEYFYDVFSKAGFDLSRSQDRLVWICFPRKSSFSTYALQAEGMDLSWLDGYYSTLTNRVAIVQTDQRGRRREEAVPPSGSGPETMVAAHRSPREGGEPQTRSSAFGGPVLAMAATGPQFDVTRLTHELAHQLSFNSGIQKRGVMYPLWVSEGLATNFEFDGTGSAGLEHGNVPRCNGLLEAYAAGELTPLRQFVVQTTVSPDLHVGRRTYAQAWGFFQFLLTEYPEGLRGYLQHAANDHLEHRDPATMLAEFTEAFGSPDALEVSWNAFLAHQAQQAFAGCVAASVDVTRTP